MEKFNINKLFDRTKGDWDALIDAIIDGNVIPVIGSDFLIDEGNAHIAIIRAFEELAGIPQNHTSFSSLMYDRVFLDMVGDKPDNLYQIVNSLLADEIELKPSESLIDLLSIRQFPFVITTSFTSVVEDVMKKIWDSELKVMNFSNDPRHNHDIQSEIELSRPTVYYMFGKACDSANRFVLTDNDMLCFCQSWLSETNARPKTLSSLIKEKYLLMFGNNYSDWLFRFIWFSIRNINSKGYQKHINHSDRIGLYTNATIEDDLSKFLERNHTFMQDNPREVVRQIKKRLEKKLYVNELTKFDDVDRKADIFISYSRTDSAIASRLYEELSKSGKRVWYDRKNLSAGSQFVEEIKRGIQNARYFVPIFTTNIEKEKKDPHFYRTEWHEAIEKSKTLGRTYIVPIYQNGFDFYKACIPDAIQHHNAIEFNSEEDIPEIAKKIIHVMNQE